AALPTEADDTREQLVWLRRLVAGADATLHRPLVSGAPGEVGPGADLGAKDIVIVVTRAVGEGQLVGEIPVVFGKQRPLLVILGGAGLVIRAIHPEHAVFHLRQEVLATQSEMVIADSAAQFGIKNGVA